MIDFFHGQMDYIFFFYGLAFLMLGAVCSIMMKQKMQRLPWGWLGLFGFTHAVHEWLGIVIIVRGHSFPSLDVIRILLVLASFLALTEFGRAGVLSLSGRGPGRWIFAPLLALASVGALSGFAGLEAASRYAIGLVGGLWASYALFLASRGLETLPRGWLVAGSATIGLYALSTGVVPPTAPFFPASLLNSNMFLLAFGFPIHLARGFFATLAAISIWTYSQIPPRDADLHENSPKHTFWPVVILFFIIVTGWILTEFADYQARGGELLNSIGHVRAYRLFSIFTTLVFFSSTIVFFTTLYFARESTARLRKYHEHLEDLVKERTTKLSEANQELKTINKELNDFAYVVSHDLKEPLRAISSLSSWLATDYAAKFDEPGKEQMDLLLKRVARMYDLIDGVLQYSRAGRIREEKVEVNLNDLMKEIIEMLSEKKDIRVIVEDVLPTVRFERTRIEQIFQNLLSNAVKFMDKPDGEIRIACVVDNGYYRFSVKDNGPGIEERHFERIFQMFQTLTSRDEFESTGVGLAVVKKIVEMYGGRVWVESIYHQGSTFHFTLPAAGRS